MTDKSTRPSAFSALDRRSLLKGVAVTGAALSMPFVWRSTEARAAGRVVWATFGGTVGEAYDRIFIKPFMDETGIEVVQTGAADLAKVKASVMAGRPEWDILSLAPSQAVSAVHEGLLEPIDYSIITAKADDLLYPEAIKEHWVSTQIYTGGIAYDRSLHPNGPNSWIDFWNVEEFPGRRGLRSRPLDMLEIALLADGVPANEVFPLDVDRAFASLDRIKPHVVNWIDTAPQSIQLVQTKEIDFSFTYHNRVAAAQAEGLPMTFSTDQLLVFLNAYSIPKGSRNAESAMKFLNFIMTRPDLQKELWDATRLIPLSKEATAMITEDEHKLWVPDQASGRHVIVDAEWWGEPGRLAEVTARYQAWLLT
jgi:putative spermidine/putrescine transport system substrate-binding protein